MAEPRRISQTVIKPLAGSHEAPPREEGFQAELPGWDLPTLLQMTCARGSRVCVEIKHGELRGYVYMNEGRLIHACLGLLVGEAAIAQMLDWPGGAFALCERPWPLKPSIDESPDLVLLRLAQARDEASHAASPRPTAFARPLSSPAARRVPETGRPNAEPPASTAAARLAQLIEPAAADASKHVGPVLASVRIDINGEIVAVQGNAESLAPLVGYVTRMGALIGLQLGLDSFDALSADFGNERALIYTEGEQMVGLLLAPGASYQELRQQLGV